MTQKFRTPTGGQIDRTKIITFHFDGRRYEAHPGDTLASALLANGVRLTGRSFKYHRPRGILTAGPEEPCALATIGEGPSATPNLPMTTVELTNGLVARSQNRYPLLAFDLLAINSLLAPFISAGFYYKTFMWPKAAWEKIYEKLIRRAAGLGRLSGKADPGHYEKANLFCDVLVIGAGPAGLAAALAAGENGARVILCEQDSILGGRLNADRRVIEQSPALHWAHQAEAILASRPETQILRRCTVFGAYDGGTYGALERPTSGPIRERMWRIVAGRCILTTGAIERPLVFGNNDLPGIMLAGAVRTYLNRYAVAPGTRAVVFTNNDDAASTVADLIAANIEVAALVDARAPTTAAVRAIAAQTGVPLFEGATIQHAIGRRKLRSAALATADGRTTHLACDLLAISGGWNPTVHLASHMGGKPIWNTNLAAFTPGTLPSGMIVAGAAAGAMTTRAALATGIQAGNPTAPVPEAPDEPSAITPLWSIPHNHGKAFVDWGNDVTETDIALSAQEGFQSVEHLKRYTTLGMAPDGGKLSNVNGLAQMAAQTGQGIAQTGTTIYRPPYTPVSIGALAGPHRGKEFRPTRLTPGHAWAEQRGAVFVDAGQWRRASYFPTAGESSWQQSVTREVQAVRTSVGLCDVSTLGKIELAGPDAQTLLDRVYANTFATLRPGFTRYGLMLREDGFVLDDGTTARLPDRFVMTTTTANAAKVMQHLEFAHQILWPDLDVRMTSITDQWAQYAVAGPNARTVLSELADPPFNLSHAAFPPMAAAELTICNGTPARLFRLSFSGELAYEIAVPARYGEALASRLMQAGAPWNITPYGVEALSVLRIEKGHVAGGELNGQTTAYDLGLGRMLAKKKDYIGRALASRAALNDPVRPRLVGLLALDPKARLRAGAHMLAGHAPATAANDAGWITSSAWSPTLNCSIALAMLKHGPERHGEILRVHDPLRDGDTLARIVPPVFVDPEGTRANG